MSESQTVPEPPAPAPAAESITPPAGFIDILVKLFTEPRAAFAAVKAHPGGWWLPLLGCVLLNLLFVGVWVSKVDARQFIKNQIEESGRADKIPADRFEEVVDTQARFMKPFTLVIGPLGPVIASLVLAALFLFVYRFFYEGQVGFAQSLSVVAWSYLALALVTVPLTLAVMGAKGDWNVDPAGALGANLTLFLEKGQTAHALYVLASSIDLFTFWVLFLLASGYGVLVRKPTSSAMWGVVLPWVIWVVGKVALTALFR